LIWLSGERANEFAGRIGEHYEKAGHLSAGVRVVCTRRAAGTGCLCVRFSDGYYEKALNFSLDADRSPGLHLQKMEICEQLAEVLSWQARYSEAIIIYERMMDLAR
jgi:hypothetical protein